MVITFGDQSLDLNKVDSIDDLDVFLSTIKGQKTLTRKETARVPDTFELFDELTERDIAILNLHYALSSATHKLKEKLFPNSVGRVIAIAMLTKQENIIKTPAVDSESYGLYQKVCFFNQYIVARFNISLQSRMGFGLNIMINNGKIYVIKDLRELHKAFI